MRQDLCNGTAYICLCPYVCLSHLSIAAAAYGGFAAGGRRQEISIRRPAVPRTAAWRPVTNANTVTLSADVVFLPFSGLAGVDFKRQAPPFAEEPS